MFFCHSVFQTPIRATSLLPISTSLRSLKELQQASISIWGKRHVCSLNLPITATVPGWWSGKVMHTSSEGCSPCSQISPNIKTTDTLITTITSLDYHVLFKNFAYWHSRGFYLHVQTSYILLLLLVHIKTYKTSKDTYLHASALSDYMIDSHLSSLLLCHLITLSVLVIMGLLKAQWRKSDR